MSKVKDQVKTLIDELSDSDVEILIQVAQRLAEWEATQEILDNPELIVSTSELVLRLRKDLKNASKL